MRFLRERKQTMKNGNGVQTPFRNRALLWFLLLAPPSLFATVWLSVLMYANQSGHMLIAINPLVGGIWWSPLALFLFVAYLPLLYVLSVPVWIAARLVGEVHSDAVYIFTCSTAGAAMGGLAFFFEWLAPEESRAVAAAMFAAIGGTSALVCSLLTYRLRSASQPSHNREGTEATPS